MALRYYGTKRTCCPGSFLQQSSLESNPHRSFPSWAQIIISVFSSSFNLLSFHACNLLSLPVHHPVQILPSVLHVLTQQPFPFRRLHRRHHRLHHRHPYADFITKMFSLHLARHSTESDGFSVSLLSIRDPKAMLDMSSMLDIQHMQSFQLR